MIVLVVPKKLDDVVYNGHYDCCRVEVARLATVKRVVRSTLAAEGYATSEAVESGYVLCSGPHR